VIPAAGVLVLLGLGLFVAGIVTDVTVLYWLCVASCVAAGVLLLLARLQMGRATAARPATAGPAAAGPPAAPPAPATTSPTSTAELPTATAVSAHVPDRPVEPVPEPGAPAGAPEPAPAEPAPAGPAGPPTGAHTAGAAAARESTDGDPPVEEVEVTDLLLVVDLRDEVLVVDEHPRYHLAGCSWLVGRPTVPLPLDEARTDGFTPCARCAPDRTLADRARARRAG
jgi:hypothetical protein